MKVRECPECGTRIEKDTSSMSVRAVLGSPTCPTCTKILLGEDRPEYWTG